MILGTGIDIIEVHRVGEKVSKENGFKTRVFSRTEIYFCERWPDKNQNYAARFAAKEAFLKAIGKGLTAGVELHEIQVVHDTLGKPVYNSAEILKSWRWRMVGIKYICRFRTCRPWLVPWLSLSNEQRSTY